MRNATDIIELEQSISDNKLKNVLLRSVSHELRTPINAISFLTEDLLQESDLSAENCEKLKIISVSAKFLLSLVNDLLDYSKMLAGVFSINRSQLNLSTILNDVLELIKIQAERRKISLILRLDPKLPKIINSDPLRLQQVLLNLLSNALKFTLKGSIEIICSLSSQNSIKITVKDTGIGIKNSQLKLLFTEFNTENDTVLNPQGCGLGLNISNKIIKEIGKNPMTVISNYGQGSEFTFEVIINDYPEDSDVFVEDPSYNDTNEDAAYDSSWLQTIEIKKIPQVLIVDDNDFNRRIIVTLLTKYNITSAEASNGQEALDLLITYKNHNNQNFKVILMDGEMPVLDG